MKLIDLTFIGKPSLASFFAITPFAKLGRKEDRNTDLIPFFSRKLTAARYIIDRLSAVGSFAASPLLAYR